MVAAIRPGGKAEGVWALPKGLVGPGEPPADTALREVTEETGARGRLGPKLGDVRYVYTWPKGAEGARSSGPASSALPATLPAPGERVFKVVSFYLVRYSGGRLGDVPAEFAHEVAEVRWLPLEDAPRLLAYAGEREIAQRALAALSGEPL
jgi:8-oxo-dGTP diphosphatase